MNTIVNASTIAFNGVQKSKNNDPKNDLSFISDIRDRDTETFDKLQKQKVEILLKYRDAKNVVDRYHAILEEAKNHPDMVNYVTQAKKDLSEMETYKNLLLSKLREINLQILAEEEKNY